MELFVMVVLTVLILFVVSVVIFIVLPLMIGASFEITRDKDLERMLRFAKVKKGEKVVELGSGDGKLVIAFAKKGAEVHGYEVNPLLVLWSKWKIYRAGLRGKAFVHWMNFWNVDLGKFDVVLAFQVFYIMGMLEAKLKREARQKIRVVSNNWKFPNLKILKQEEKIYYYEVRRR